MSNSRARDTFLSCLLDCDQAMGGSVPFEVALGQRLELLQPTRQQLDQFLIGLTLTLALTLNPNTPNPNPNPKP